VRTTARLARGLDAATLTVRLERAAYRLAAHLGELEDRLEQGGVDAWPEYLATVETLATILPAVSAQQRGRLLTTGELAARLGVSSKTVLRRRRAGQLQGRPWHCRS
jgi:hypothetical protein